MSADGEYGLTLIAFIGSVFSPYYAWARRRGRADPMNHCALNVALYGRRGARWSMTERGTAAVARETSRLIIGRSALDWSGGELNVVIDEICAPIPRRIRGTVRLRPSGIGEHSYLLDAAGRHRWTPFAPCAHVEVRLEEPALHWTGIAYLDSNAGDEPLEDAFQRWTWSRASVPDGTVVLYDVTHRAAAGVGDAAGWGNAAADGVAPAMALRFAADATVQIVEPPPEVALPISGWRVARRTRADAGHGARIVQTLEDAPFYNRSLLQTHLLGHPAPAIHEALDLDRFSSGWVQCLLPFRMPRGIL